MNTRNFGYHFALLAASTFAISGCGEKSDSASVSPTAAPVASSSEIADNVNMSVLTFDVKGMTCAGCENAVTRSLAQLPGVASSSADHVKGKVEVSTTDPTITARVIEAIESLNFTAESAEG